jgi:2-polyprenyl-3-methyl-5-hydroxy-6-metoxy-1,4-benzoquinol methylase
MVGRYNQDMTLKLTGAKDWDNAWHQHYAEYTQRPSYQAYYLFCILPNKTRRILELGAGSFRDTAQLNEWGYECIGVDFSEGAVASARQRYPQWASRFLSADAMRLPFRTGSFDVSYHNGLLVYFEDNEKIRQIIREQVRLSRTMVVCTVHNAHNSQLQELFKQRAQKDPIYAIRFFERSEIAQLMAPFCRRVELFPFGSLWANRLIRHLRQRHLVRLFYRRTYKYWDWTKCERIMAVGWL